MATLTINVSHNCIDFEVEGLVNIGWKGDGYLQPDDINEFEPTEICFEGITVWTRKSGSTGVLTENALLAIRERAIEKFFENEDTYLEQLTNN